LDAQLSKGKLEKIHGCGDLVQAKLTKDICKKKRSAQRRGSETEKGEQVLQRRPPPPGKVRDLRRGVNDTGTDSVLGGGS